MEGQNLEGIQKRYESLGREFERLLLENEALKNTIRILEAEKRQWDEAKVMQTEVVQKTLENNNNLMQAQANEIQSLKDRLRRYEGE